MKAQRNYFFFLVLGIFSFKNNHLIGTQNVFPSPTLNQHIVLNVKNHSEENDKQVKIQGRMVIK